MGGCCEVRYAEDVAREGSSQEESFIPQAAATLKAHGQAYGTELSAVRAARRDLQNLTEAVELWRQRRMIWARENLSFVGPMF